MSDLAILLKLIIKKLKKFEDFLLVILVGRITSLTK